MKLPIPTFLQTKEKPEYFLALLLRDEKVSAAIVQQLQGTLHVVSEHIAHFSDTLESATEEELLTVLDNAISEAENALSLEIGKQKTIFGVKEQWVEGAKIKKEYLAKLKKISDELDLLPIGFLVIHEAIAHLLQQEEGAPLSAILAEIGKKEIAISVIRAGKIIDTKRAPIEESVAKTTDRLLHHFTNFEILPSRIILFDGDQNTEFLSQKFIEHGWSKSLPFLHMPQVTALPKGFDAKAILFGAAKQMGFEVLQQEPSRLHKHTPEQITLATEQEYQQQEVLAETLDESEIAISEKTEEPENRDILLENFGFVQETDVALHKQSVKEVGEQTEEENEEEVDESETAIIPERIGGDTKEFAIPHFLQVAVAKFPVLFTKITKIGPLILSFLPKKKTHHTMEESPPQTIHHQPTHPIPTSFPHIPMFPVGKKLLMLPIVVLGLCLAVFLLYMFTVSATVTISVLPKVIEQTKQVTFATNTPTDITKNAIQATLISVSEDGTLSTPTTGTKETGEKAKGGVTIYNSDLSSSKTLPVNTVVKSPNGLTFSLDSTTTIASASGDASSITSSTAKVSVTASDFGKEYNMPSGTKFTVDSFDTSTVIGKNDSAFEGGSKQEVTVVAKADIDKLTTGIVKTLESKANNDLAKKEDGNIAVLPNMLDSTLTKKDFDKKVGTEAKTVSLTATVSYQKLTYKKSDLADFAKKLLSNNQLDVLQQETSTAIGNPLLKDNKITADVNATSKLIPKMDKQKIAQQIIGKSFKDATDIISHLPQIAQVIIVLRPNIPLLPKILPNNSNHIMISITNGN